MIPTIKQICRAYPFFAAAERMKTGRPSEVSVHNVLSGVHKLCKASGLSVRAPISAFTRQVFDKALVTFMDRGHSRVSVRTYLQQFQALLGRWTRPYYADAGWEIPPIDLPNFRAIAPRYARPSPELLRQVRTWYLGLTPDENDTRHTRNADIWFAATMMLEFAVRNGDVLRLTRDNFVLVKPETSDSQPAAPGPQPPPRHFLSYTPHKTALTSGRRVFWPIHDDIWERIEQRFILDRPPSAIGRPLLEENPFKEINRQLRTIGIHSNKASYELRKICIDHVYQRFGAEMASSISGDDLKTITHYYADPAQPNIGNVRVVDLLPSP